MPTCYTEIMPTRTFYSDAKTEAELAYLATDYHEARFSTIVQMAIHDAAEAKRRAALRAEAEALRNDPVDRAAALALQRELDEIRVW